jgi:hypothetical protein
LKSHTTDIFGDKKVSGPGKTMDFSIALAGIQSASAHFDAAATALVQTANSGYAPPGSTAAAPTTITGDSADLSTAVVSLLNAQRSFSANIATAIVEDNLNQSTFSIAG